MSDLLAPLRLDAGIYYDLNERIYHGDPAIEPSLSAGFAKVMMEASPKRAAAGHPRLNPMMQHGEPTAAMDEGSILHALILNDGPKFRVINAKDYKTDAAKAMKQKAREAGEIPILTDKLEELEHIADQARRLIEMDDENGQVLGGDYASEVSLIWRDPCSVMCRARPDRMHRTDGSAPIYDFKFTDRLKNPADWDRVMIDSWWDMRAAFYVRGASELRDGEQAPYRFIVVEKESPVDVMVFEMTKSFMAIGAEKAATGIYMWQRCLRANRFPGFPRRTFWIEEPGWAESKWRSRASVEHLLPPDPNAPACPAEKLVGGLQAFARTAVPASPLEDRDAGQL